MKKYTYKNKYKWKLIFAFFIVNAVSYYYHVQYPTYKLYETVGYEVTFFMKYSMFFIMNGVFLLICGIVGLILYLNRNLYGYTTYLEGNTLVVEKKGKKRFNIKTIPEFGFMYIGKGNYRFFFKTNKEKNYEYLCDGAVHLVKEIKDRLSDYKLEEKEETGSLKYIKKNTVKVNGKKSGEGEI